MSNMITRILAGVIGIPIVVLLIWLGGWWFSGAIIIVTTVALWEFYKLASSGHATANMSVGLAWGLVLQVLFAQSIGTMGTAGIVWMGLALMTILVGTVVVVASEIWRDRPHATLNIAVTVMGVVYVTLGMTTLLFLRGTAATADANTFGFDGGGALVLALFVAVWARDSLAYFTGLSIGRHKLLERVSPKKTEPNADVLRSNASVSRWSVITTSCAAAVASGLFSNSTV